MTYDLLIVGGGVNGTAIAREAALNGLSVLLVERGDLAGATSSASTKLIHGGLRYLETLDFALVRESLVERARLLRTAPHLVTPLTFVLPHDHAVRPWWMVRAGLLLYDLFAIGGRLPRSRALRRRDTGFTAPLKGGARGFVYTDAWVDDARLTLAYAQDAAENGAAIATRTALVAARRDGGRWLATLSDGRTVAARGLVNAAGPWVAEVLGLTGVDAGSGVRLVKGSHIVVPRLFAGSHAYILQQPDRRIVFAIPYRDRFTLIGTTDVPVSRPGDAVISDAEIAYLCEAANRHFAARTTPADIVSHYSGVRPLFDDGTADAKAVTRDYVLELDGNGPPLLSVFGGKITTARHLGEEALARIAAPLGRIVRPVTRDRTLPGGDIGDLAGHVAAIDARFPFLGRDRADRMARAYGSRLVAMMAGAAAPGRDLGGGLTDVEVRWMRDHEWARTAQDVLWRRSKLGLDGGVDVAAVEAVLAEATR